MIDIENYVVDYIQTKFERAGKNVFVDSLFQPFPEEFPCVTVREIQNIPLDSTFDQQLSEHFARVNYQIDIVVSETPIKAKCKELLAIADEAMTSLKFTRYHWDVSTSEDRTLAWGTARYRAVVGEPKENGDISVYQMYR